MKKILFMLAVAMVLAVGIVSAQETTIAATTDGLTTTLTCENDYGATVFDWNFGDGTTLTDVSDQTVEHTYASAGRYGVTCSGWSREGGSMLAWQQVVVEGETTTPPEQPPEQTEGTTLLVEKDGLTGMFTCQNDFGATVFDWNFGDGTVLTDVSEMSVEHTYAELGRYGVSCSAWSREHGSDLAYELVKFEGETTPPPEEPSCVDCQDSYLLSASKSYGPSAWTDASRDMCSEQTFMLPETLDVTTGNAGNHWSFLTIGSGVDAQTCFYQGGSSQAHPNSAEQLALGEEYHFVTCQEGTSTTVPPTGVATNLTAGDTFSTDYLNLNVNGDSNQGTTQVDLILDNQNSCEEEPAPQSPATELNVNYMTNLTTSYTCGTNFDATTYDWNFGDGTFLQDVSDATVEHTYPSAGRYGVWCAAWSSEVGQYGDWQNIEVG